MSKAGGTAGRSAAGIAWSRVDSGTGTEFEADLESLVPTAKNRLVGVLWTTFSGKFTEKKKK